MASSTPFAHVRIPLTGPLLPPAPLKLKLYYLGENYPAAEKLTLVRGDFDSLNMITT